MIYKETQFLGKIVNVHLLYTKKGTGIYGIENKVKKLNLKM